MRLLSTTEYTLVVLRSPEVWFSVVTLGVALLFGVVVTLGIAFTVEGDCKESRRRRPVWHRGHREATRVYPVSVCKPDG